MVFHTENNDYSTEEIAELWNMYHKAKPYTKQDWIDLPFDGELDVDKILAAEAEEILKELGLLED